MNSKAMDRLRLVLGLVVVVTGAVALIQRARRTPSEPPPCRLTWTSPAQLEMAGRTMGPIPFKVLIVPGDATDAQAEQAARDGYAALERINRHMSAYRPDSDVSRLNRAGAGEAVTLDEELLALLAVSREYTKQTDGAFDPTARQLFQLWIAAGKAGKLPSEEQIDDALAASGWQRLALDPAARTATKAVDDLEVDLGGIAKGYAVDEVIEVLRNAGMTAGLVEVGGEVRVFGPGPHDGAWMLGLDHPFATSATRHPLAGKLAVTDDAVATSGNYRQFSVIDGRRYSHIIDPRTGRPVDTAPSVTVIADDCTTADAWATALSVLGPEGLATVEAIDGVEAMMVVGTKDDARVRRTSGFAPYLRGEIDVTVE
ncbi:MAG: FAD:protein FMN transferase [Planctomycetota bacterium]